MARVRTVRPTDLVALAGYDGRVRPNEAVTRDRIGTQASPHPLETALEQWFSFATGRHTWISVKGMTLRGLASARRRGSKAAWEVDCLIHAEEDPGVLMSLLDRVVEDAGRGGAEKVFLRVAAESDVLHAACSTGFSLYMNERLLIKEGSSPLPAGAPALRRWGRADAYPTFRLYSHWAPEPVRRVEAATFREWLASREAISPSRGTSQWALEHEGEIAGCLRVAADGEVGRFDLLADPSAPELLDALIDAALARLSEQSQLLTLVPEYARPLLERLEEREFEEREAFVVLARRTTRPVPVAERAQAAPVHSLPT